MLVCASFIALTTDTWERRLQFMNSLASKMRQLELCTFHITCRTFSFTLISNICTDPDHISVQRHFFARNSFLALTPPQPQIFPLLLSFNFIPKTCDKFIFILKPHTASIARLQFFQPLLFFSSAVQSSPVSLYAAQLTLPSTLQPAI